VGTTAAPKERRGRGLLRPPDIPVWGYVLAGGTLAASGLLSLFVVNSGFLFARFKGAAVSPSAAIAAFGFAVLAVSKTRLLSGWRALVIPVVAASLVAFANAEGVLSPATLGIWFVVICVWMGAFLPQGSVAAFSPVVLAAYLVPLYTGAPRSREDAVSSVFVVFAGVICGEVLAAIASSNRRLQERQWRELARLAHENLTDPLTKVGNRRLADKLLESLAPGDAVMLVDIDNLKLVNDNFGHAIGDETIRIVADRMDDAIRENDALARLGGDEFIVVMRRAGGSTKQAALRVFAGLAQGQQVTTVSAGVAVHRHGRPAKATVDAADAALLAAKRAGRARIAFEGERGFSTLGAGIRQERGWSGGPPEPIGESLSRPGL
jgi:diguanylate cyclase (GGDEF)-like protein